MRWMFDLTWVFILYVALVIALFIWDPIHMVDYTKVGEQWVVRGVEASSSSLEADVVACHTEYPTEPFAFHACVDQALERVTP